ncbi:hypothetical protein EKO27_g7158 [Xylaria grammica]|uniref:Uncharacterized protein n=1 Tax=Xylaria grammica TaxID=363999 RepID=A0A439D0I8_9PEZI|nr:hypothetical protein EKO27_g7158 [Xylaria grammica]
MPYYSNIRSQSSDLGGARGSDESEETITEKIFEDGTAIPRKKRRYSLFSLSWLAWIPHIILLAAYSGVLLTWSNFRPHLRSTDYASVPGRSIEHWEARFLGTFSEIGDYFNVSESSDPSPGSQAAWERVQELRIAPVERKSANYIRINRAHIESPSAGDPQALTHIHRLHCLHVLWRRWHGQITDEETAEGIALPVHDDHCFDILRYALMCEGDIIIKKVGWTETEETQEGWIDVERFCEDPEVAEGVEAGKKKANMAEASTSTSKPKKGY